MITLFSSKMKRKKIRTTHKGEGSIFTKKMILLAVFMAFLISTSAKCTDHELQNRVSNYYNLEKESNWEETYLYRTPLYRKSIKFKLYKRKMERNNKEWKLIEFKILESIVKQNYAAFKIEFIEKVPQGYFPFNAYNSTKITQISTWEKIDNIWYTRDACTRTHLPLNGDLVMNDNQAPINFFSEYIQTGSVDKLEPIKTNLEQPKHP